MSEYVLVLGAGRLFALVEQPNGDIPSLEAGDVVLGSAPPAWAVWAMQLGIAEGDDDFGRSLSLRLAPGVEARGVPERLWAAWRDRPHTCTWCPK